MPEAFRGLPSLGGMQAFEVAARLLSFAKTAEALNLTPTAVSHRIRNLEAEIGTPLFRRTGRAVALTREGERLAAGIGEAFDRLRVTVLKSREMQASRLSLLVEATFASFWLLPRLGEFADRHPTIAVNLVASEPAGSLERTGADLVIALDPDVGGDMHYDCLGESRLRPVCSPAYPPAGALAQGDRDAWREARLLHMTDASLGPPFPEWRQWFEAAGIARPDPERGPQFGSCGLVMQAAAYGQGVGLGVDLLCGEAIASGRLVALSEVALAAAQAYGLVIPAEHMRRPAVRAFRSWLLAELREAPRPIPPPAPTVADRS